VYTAETRVLLQDMDLSGKIRAFVAGPFAFQDYSMECRFQRHFIDSIFDRTRRIMCVWLPFVGIMRIVWLAYWIVFPFDISTVDLIIFAIRFLFLILGSTMFMRNWADANKRRIGLANLWIARTYLVVAALGESDVHKRDPQKLASLVAYLCICGLFIPSFAEYLVCAVPLSFTRPLIMSLVSGAGKDQAQEIIFQHGLILALGISITWTAHADCRRDWLRSAATTSKCLGLRKAPPIMAGATSRGECRSGWGLFGDDYFNSSDLEEIRAESTQVELNFPDFSFGHTPCPSLPCTYSAHQLPRTLQDIAAIADRLREPPDTVPRWHRSNTIIGAGPAGYVYQVSSPRPSHTPLPRILAHALTSPQLVPAARISFSPRMVGLGQRVQRVRLRGVWVRGDGHPLTAAAAFAVAGQ
jgi:hypothetical protein